MLAMRPLALFLTISLGAWIAGPQLDPNPKPEASPTLINTCLITPNVNQLVNFYEGVLGMRAQRSGEQYAEFHTGVGVLAIFSAEAQEKYIPGSTDAATNRSAILEFRVTNVDQEYERCSR